MVQKQVQKSLFFSATELIIPPFLVPPPRLRRLFSEAAAEEEEIRPAASPFPWSSSWDWARSASAGAPGGRPSVKTGVSLVILVWCSWLAECLPGIAAPWGLRRWSRTCARRRRGRSLWGIFFTKEVVTIRSQCVAVVSARSRSQTRIKFYGVRPQTLSTELLGNKISLVYEIGCLCTIFCGRSL